MMIGGWLVISLIVEFIDYWLVSVVYYSEHALFKIGRNIADD